MSLPIQPADVLEILDEASEAILEIYRRENHGVEYKSDASPLTEADRRANEIIVRGLKARYPDIPILSEESKEIPFSERSSWQRFWLVDPVDGTKEFIKRNGEFTVNIALVEDGVPVFGGVARPTEGVVFFGGRECGAYLRERDGKVVTLDQSDRPHFRDMKKVKVVASRSHLTQEVTDFVEELKQSGKDVEFLSAGSSLKLCLVAEGKAEVYPRFGPTMEWDTAAAHAVVLGAGRKVTVAATGEPLVYNKENLLNPWFIVE
ncbi:MAG: 3'(2'),5'-bisphosphate nucleotidase CysQ [Verrucomicrobiales bacterium]